MKAPLPTKLIILVAGVVMNLSLAFVIFFAIFALAYPTWTLTINRSSRTARRPQPGSSPATMS